MQSIFSLALIVGATASSMAMAQASESADASAASATTATAATTTPAVALTGNLALVSDYRFRGISQSWKRPAVQGGLDLAGPSGTYLGVWASSVSGNSYNNGSGMELDVYGGIKWPLAQDLVLDVGVLAYLYPGARLNSAPGQPTGHRYDNVDVYVGFTRGAFSAKLSVAATDYFGLDSSTAGFAYFSALPARGASKGSSYLDLNYSLELGGGVTAGLHAGHLWMRRYGDLSYTDWKLSLSAPAAGWVWSAALAGTDADAAYYRAADAGGGRAKRLGNTGVVLGVSRSF